jgi:hypothetical protein
MSAILAEMIACELAPSHPVTEIVPVARGSAVACGCGNPIIIPMTVATTQHFAILFGKCSYCLRIFWAPAERRI